MPLIGLLPMRLPRTSGPVLVSDGAWMLAKPVLRPQSVTRLVVQRVDVDADGGRVLQRRVGIVCGDVSLFWMMLLIITG